MVLNAAKRSYKEVTTGYTRQNVLVNLGEKRKYFITMVRGKI